MSILSKEFHGTSSCLVLENINFYCKVSNLSTSKDKIEVYSRVLENNNLGVLFQPKTLADSFTLEDMSDKEFIPSIKFKTSLGDELELNLVSTFTYSTHSLNLEGIKVSETSEAILEDYLKEKGLYAEELNVEDRSKTFYIDQLYLTNNILGDVYIWDVVKNCPVAENIKEAKSNLINYLNIHNHDYLTRLTSDIYSGLLKDGNYVGTMNVNNGDYTIEASSICGAKDKLFKIIGLFCSENLKVKIKLNRSNALISGYIYNRPVFGYNQPLTKAGDILSALNHYIRLTFLLDERVVDHLTYRIVVITTEFYTRIYIGDEWSTAYFSELRHFNKKLNKDQIDKLIDETLKTYLAIKQ